MRRESLSCGPPAGVSPSKASASITFPDQRWLRFQVPGTSEISGILTAVDQAGIKVVRFRRRGSSSDCGTDVVVHPDRELTEESMLANALSADWLHRYFQTSHPAQFGV